MVRHHDIFPTFELALSLGPRLNFAKMTELCSSVECSMAMGNSLKITWCESMRSCITQMYTGRLFFWLWRDPHLLGPRSNFSSGMIDMIWAIWTCLFEYITLHNLISLTMTLKQESWAWWYYSVLSFTPNSAEGFERYIVRNGYVLPVWIAEERL